MLFNVKSNDIFFLLSFRAAFENAFQYWSKVNPLRFEETLEDADINILFAKGDHGDGTYNAFDGKGILKKFLADSSR